MTITQGDSKPQRQRSPAYPSVGLAEAIKLAGRFWEKEKRHEAFVGVASQHFGFKAGSSSGLQTAAALTYYGLMEQSGSKESRSVKLTDLAISILSTTDSPTRDALLKQAVLRPKIHAELLTKYDGELPSDPTLRNYLTFDRGFNAGMVDDFIRQFRHSLAFAKVIKSDTLPPVSGTNVEFDTDEEELEMTPQNATTPTAMPSVAPLRSLQRTPQPESPADGGLFLVVPYKGKNLTVRVSVDGERLNRDHVAKVRKYLELAEEDLGEAGNADA